MLDRKTTDTRTVVSRVLTVMASICCAFVLASFLMFARDQLAGASAHQQNEIATVSSNVVAKAPSTTHHQPRRFIDGAAHDLTSPFSAIVSSNDAWVSHGLPAFFALVVYGGGLGFLARYSRGFS